MTERKREAVTRDTHHLSIGASGFTWNGTALEIAIDEISVPFPSRLRGTIRIEPTIVNTQPFALDRHAHHVWQPIAPAAHVSLDFSTPNLRWTGIGYFDTNTGREPLGSAFIGWTWARAPLRRGAAVLYDAERRADGPLSLALRFDQSGRCEPSDPLPRTALPRTGWGLSRHIGSDDGVASIERRFEDAPFYSRSLVSTRWFGERVAAMHESLSMGRFANPLVRLMLPFRMPRH